MPIEQQENLFELDDNNKEEFKAEEYQAEDYEEETETAEESEVQPGIEKQVEKACYTDEELQGYECKELKEIASKEFGLVVGTDFTKNTKKPGMIKLIKEKQGGVFEKVIKGDSNITDIKTKETIIPPDMCEKWEQNQPDAVITAEVGVEKDTLGVPEGYIRANVMSDPIKFFFFQMLNDYLKRDEQTFGEVLRRCQFSAGKWGKAGKLERSAELRISIGLTDLLSIYHAFYGNREGTIKAVKQQKETTIISLEKGRLRTDLHVDSNVAKGGLALLTKVFNIMLTDEAINEMNRTQQEYSCQLTLGL